jgi:hypothetical protein
MSKKKKKKKEERNEAFDVPLIWQENDQAFNTIGYAPHEFGQRERTNLPYKRIGSSPVSNLRPKDISILT